MKTQNTQSKGEIIIYQNKEGNSEINVQLQDQTVWLTQKQIAMLFGVQRPAITKHFKNIFEEGELIDEAVSSILEHTANDGNLIKPVSITWML